MQFEDLEKDPVNEVKRIYSELGLSFSDNFESDIRQFVSDNKHYQKNRYLLSDEDKEIIRSNPSLSGNQK